MSAFFRFCLLTGARLQHCRQNAQASAAILLTQISKRLIGHDIYCPASCRERSFAGGRGDRATATVVMQ
jgi:hypothetical protein